MEELSVLYDTFSVRKFNAGAKIFAQDAAADSFALVLNGRAQLSRGGPSGLPVVFDSAEEGAPPSTDVSPLPCEASRRRSFHRLAAAAGAGEVWIPWIVPV